MVRMSTKKVEDSNRSIISREVNRKGTQRIRINEYYELNNKRIAQYPLSSFVLFL